MKSITIRTISIDKNKIVGQKIIGGDNKNEIIDIPMNRNIYLGMLAEMKKANIPVDSELKCFNNRIFTIVEVQRSRVKGLTVEPIAFGVTLRRDI